MSDYLDILKEWERDTANPAIYRNLDILLPEFDFTRYNAGGERDHWGSPLKADLSRPKTPCRQKTVVYASDMKIREQGEWSNAESVTDRLRSNGGYGSVYQMYCDIADRLGLTMPSPTSSDTGKESRSTRKRVLETLQKYFAWNLENNSSQNCRRTLAYLRWRGFTEEQIREYGFGFVPSWDKVERYITSPRTGILKKELDTWCRVRNSEGRTWIGERHTLSIPYTSGNEIRGFLFRTLEDDVKPKYMASSGLDRRTSLFNCPERVKGEVLIVEGEMDALSCSAAGIENSTAMGGADLSGERRAQVADVLRRGASGIILCPDLDSDERGEANREKRFNAVRRSLHSIFDVCPEMINVKVAVFDEPSDPNEYICRHGAEKFRKLISEAKPWWSYLNEQLEEAAKKNPGHRDQGDNQ